MNDVNIGAAIENRLRELRLSKSEFSRMIDMPQQNVHRILRSKYINTEKLVQISEVLNYNFFELYCDNPSINAVASGDSSIAAVNSEVQSDDSRLLMERVRYLERILSEKERLIQFLLKEKPLDEIG